MRRTPSRPPELPGYDYLRLLGTGGFSDVFLYEQRLPRRQVAVKVLLPDELTVAARKAFVDEANLMAQLSAHPYIVTIYAADIADGDRPYFVMEYCSGPSLAERYKSERFSVADALRTGIRLSSAIATAHDAGILHRDIKPGNVLTNDYGWPALTDFGISSTVDESPVLTTTASQVRELRDAAGGTTESQSIGMSVPWSPAEMFEDDPHPDVRSDVFSLAATIHTLLAARTPFEIAGRPNGTLDLIGRIERGMITPIGRDDIPLSLTAVLHRGMALRREDRYASALEFARALQRVELELGYSPTTIEVPNLHIAAPSSAQEGDETRVRGVATIQAQPTAPPAAPTPEPEADATRVRGVTVVPTAAADDATVVRRVPGPADPITTTLATPGEAAEGSDASDESDEQPRRFPLVPVLVGAVAAIVAAAVVVSVVLSGGAAIEKPTPTPSGTGDSAVVGGAVPAPEFVSAERSADGTTVTFTFEGSGDAAQYLWAPAEQPDARTPLDEPVVVRADAQPGVRVCVQLVAVLNGRTSATAEGCDPE